jgi:1-acyl-sn-glycerol-3-phosphate acyltransferase
LDDGRHLAGAARIATAGPLTLRLALALWRILRAVGLLLQGAAICAFVFPFATHPARMGHVGRWSARVLRALGIELHSRGEPRPGPSLVVANHVSWLDILAINALQPARFVSKADVHGWPLIGWLVACGGTLFIERERRRDALRVVHQMAQALRDGAVVAVFPEGTTTDGRGVLAFHANLLQAAVVTGTPVQPVALRFSDASRPVSPAAAYVGDTSLLQSLWWIVTARGLRAHVEWLAVTPDAGSDRRALSQALRRQILNALDARPWTP